jgi:hypothetical protein
MQSDRGTEYIMGYPVGKMESMEAGLAEFRSLVTAALCCLC